MTTNRNSQWINVSIDRVNNQRDAVSLDKVGGFEDVDHGFRSSPSWKEEFDAGYKRFCLKYQLPCAGWGKDAFDFANYDNARDEVLPHPDECLRDPEEEVRPSLVTGFDPDFDQIAA